LDYVTTKKHKSKVYYCFEQSGFYNQEFILAEQFRESKHSQIIIDSIDQFIVGSETMASTVQQYLKIDKQKVLLLGNYATDIFFDSDYREKYENLISKNEELITKKIILFTYYQDEIVTAKKELIELEAKLDDSYSIITMCEDDTKVVIEDFYDAYEFGDIKVLLGIIDTLVTKDSSLICDFAHFKKKIILYKSDIDEQLLSATTITELASLITKNSKDNLTPILEK